MRDSFIFYKSFYEAISKLEKKSDKLEIYEAIFQYIFFDENPELKNAPAMAFALIKPQLDANNVKYENGRKGGRPKIKTEKYPKQNQTETEPKRNENENVNVNENVNENENVEPALPELKPLRHPTGKHDNVYLSSDEVSKLISEFGETLVKKEIDSLSQHLKTKKNNIKDDAHYFTIQQWAQEDKDKPTEPKPKEVSKTHNYSQREYTEEEYKEMERRALGTD